MLWWAQQTLFKSKSNKLFRATLDLSHKVCGKDRCDNGNDFVIVYGWTSTIDYTHSARVIHYRRYYCLNPTPTPLQPFTSHREWISGSRFYSSTFSKHMGPQLDIIIKIQHPCGGVASWSSTNGRWLLPLSIHIVDPPFHCQPENRCCGQSAGFNYMNCVFRSLTFGVNYKAF